jgi:hypothetical protein
MLLNFNLKGGKMKHTYKDFVTGKPRYTQGVFRGWTTSETTKSRYACFHNRKSIVYVPEYLLTQETKHFIAQAEKQA